MKNTFFVKLLPARPSFLGDITPEEAALMQNHAAYWADLMGNGRVHVFGPVFDPDGVYGMGVVHGEDEADIHALLAKDPAAKLMNFKVSRMEAVLPA